MIEKGRLISLVEFVQQSARLRAKPTSTVAQHGQFSIFEHQFRELPGVHLSVVGRTQKTVDLELLLPTTGERAFVQIKSQANSASLREYIDRFSEAAAYDRMFFVWHSGTVEEGTIPSDVAVIGPERLSRMVLDAGLSSWLRDKVS